MKRILISLACVFFFLSAFQYNLLSQDMGLQGVLPEESKMKVSGFMSMDCFYINFSDLDNSVMTSLSPNFNENVSFYQSHVNLYFSYKANKDWSAFSEIKFNYSPTGDYQLRPHDDDISDIETAVSATTGETHLISTYDIDQTTSLPYLYAFPNSTNHYDQYFYSFGAGSIYIERAYIQWNRFSFATIRAGRYITPYGIYSQDHGAPALTGIRPPTIVTSPIPEFGMPSTQTGLELLGSMSLPMDLFVEYAVYIGNGISVSDAENDPQDNNKSGGGFLNIRLPEISEMVEIQFGVSGYYGQRSIIQYQAYVQNLDYYPHDDPAAPPVNALDLTNYYVTLKHDPTRDRYSVKQMEKSALAHLLVSVSNLPLDGVLTLQGEIMRQWMEMDDDVRLINPLTTFPKKIEDFEYTIYYIQCEFQMYSMLTFYYRYEGGSFTSDDTQRLALTEDVIIHTAGINYKPISSVSLKAECLILDFETPLPMDNDLTMYMASITMAF